MVQVENEFGGRIGATAATRHLIQPIPQCLCLHGPDVLGRSFDEILQRRKVVGRRRQRQTGALRDGAVRHRFESAQKQQLGSRGDKRVAPSFAFGRHR